MEKSADAGAHTTSGSVRALWLAKGGAGVAMGVEADIRVCRVAGVDWCALPICGVVYASAAGTQLVSGPIGAEWTARGAEASSLGYPVSEIGRASGRERG